MITITGNMVLEAISSIPDFKPSYTLTCLAYNDSERTKIYGHYGDDYDVVVTEDEVHIYPRLTVDVVSGAKDEVKAYANLVQVSLQDLVDDLRARSPMYTAPLVTLKERIIRTIIASARIKIAQEDINIADNWDANDPTNSIFGTMNEFTFLVKDVNGVLFIETKHWAYYGTVLQTEEIA